MSFVPLLFLALLMTPIPDATSPGQSHGPSGQPLQYVLRFPAPQTHYVEVEASVPTGGKPSVELLMAVWTPGSYLVREYARHVEDMRAAGVTGAPLAVEKTQKNRWRIQTGGAERVIVRYRVYAREMTVRTNFVEGEFALLNGAPTFVTLAERTPRAHDVRLELPAAWKTSISPLPSAPGGQPHSYRAVDFDTLVDSPILAGNPATYEFTVAGKTHTLANVGEGGVWDGPRSAADVQKIVEACAAFWGTLPYDRYVFFNLLTEAGGGLEHAASTVLMTSRWRTRTRRGYLGWLNLVGHEFFHLWNVKRLRPVELGPFEYERENPTRSLWMAEGVTDYYGDVMVARAGLSTPDEYLNSLSDAIQELQTTPGRLTQSVEEASFDAWIRYYRPDENSANTSISYYTKGAVIGFLLDMEIRRASRGAKSLDDVMRLAYKRHAGSRGYTPQQFRAVAQEVAGTDLSAWFARALESREELDYAPALEYLGLRFRREASSPERPPRAWTGLVTRTEAGRLLVSQVRRGTPGFEAGFNVDDEIVAIDDYRVRPDQWESTRPGQDSRLDAYRPGDSVAILVSRRDRLLTVSLTFGAEPARSWRLERNPDASPEQQARLTAWLKD
jgi:predicted metalloprotease with PDZ domain